MSADERVEALAKVLAEHQRRNLPGGPCWCGTWPRDNVRRDTWMQHVAEHLLASGVVAQPATVECEECGGTGRTMQGWTDKNGGPEDQYGPCARCSTTTAAPACDGLAEVVRGLADELEREAAASGHTDLAIAARQVRRTTVGRLRRILAEHGASLGVAADNRRQSEFYAAHPRTEATS